MDGIKLQDASLPVPKVRSNFDLSHNRKFDLKFGELYPVLMEPVMPSDRYSVSYRHLFRMAPFLSQVFQNYVINLDFYYVPNRVLWSNFDNFMTAGYDGKQNFVHPYIKGNSVSAYAVQNGGNFFGANPGSLFDALGIPNNYLLNADRDDKINALPFFAYLQVILDYWMGNSATDLQQLVQTVRTNGHICVDGDQTNEMCQMLNVLRTCRTNYSPTATGGIVDPNIFGCVQRLYPLDYFTEGRTDPQLGPVMTIPLQLVNTDSSGVQTFQFSSTWSGGTGTTPAQISYQTGTDKIKLQTQGGTNITVNGSVFENTATIPDFYSAARVQEFLTLMGFTGFNPSDTIAAEFGVKNNDSRLHRAEFLYHSSENMEIGEVFSNNVNVPNATEGATEFNDIAGVGTAIGKSTAGNKGFECFIPEHGFIVGLCSIYPEAGYHQGMPRIFRQLDRFEYPHPLFAELGMQATRQEEIYMSLNNLDWSNDFNYNTRYSEYKVHYNRVSGALKDSLDYMTATRKFSASPSFNDDFLRVKPNDNNLNRTFNVVSDLPTDRPIFGDIQFYINANRPLPYYGVPKFGI